MIEDHCWTLWPQSTGSDFRLTIRKRMLGGAEDEIWTRKSSLKLRKHNDSVFVLAPDHILQTWLFTAQSAARSCWKAYFYFYFYLGNESATNLKWFRREQGETVEQNWGWMNHSGTITYKKCSDTNRTANNQGGRNYSQSKTTCEERAGRAGEERREGIQICPSCSPRRR